MSRQEKGSRIRMLPARLQLQQRDAHTGSYPTVSRFSTDGRTGTYNTSFNDTKTVVFASSDNYMPGVGLSSESNWLDDDKSFDTVSTFSQEDVITLKIDTGKEAFAFAYAGKEPAVWHDTKFNILLKSVNGDATEWATVVSIYAEPDVLYVKLESDIVTDYSNGSKLYLSPHILPTTGNIRSQVIDGLPFMHFTPGQELTPFRDNDQPAADGKSSTDPFFTTGSADLLVGGGFSSPLWSKNKIEIDLPVTSTTTFSIVRGSPDTVILGPNDSFHSPMGYYNFTNKIWEPIGIGFQVDRTTLTDAVEYLTVGFFNGLLPRSTVASVQGMGYCGSDFGFPYHPKYHATSSQTLDMSQYINEPFLLEKAIITIGSASWTIGSIDLTLPGLGLTGSANTFFLLNQRKNQNYSYTKNIVTAINGTIEITSISSSIPRNVPITFDQYTNSKTTYVDTVRDILGFSQIYSFDKHSPDTYLKRTYDPVTKLKAASGTVAEFLPTTDNDIVINGSLTDISGANWITKPTYPLTLSMSMCVPPFGCYNDMPSIIHSNILFTNYSGINKYVWSGYNGTRTGLNLTSPSTQGYLNDLFSGTESEPNYREYAKQLGFTINSPIEKHKTSPYILYPTDQLILGCQVAISWAPAVYPVAPSGPPVKESILTLFKDTDNSSIKSSLTLYGSYIRNNKEFNDGTNQLLSSNGIHEVIE